MVTLNPGITIGVRVGPVIHVGIVSDRNSGGMPMVISNSFRAGGVAEEPLSVFQGGYPLVSVAQPTVLPSWHILSRARQMLGTRWNLLSWNCEHFVYWAHGLEPKSPQLKQAGAYIGLAALLMTVGRA
jgi:hypothetical protein